MKSETISRRQVLKGAGALGLLTAMERLLPLYAQTGAGGGGQPWPALSGNTIDLTIAETPFWAEAAHADGFIPKSEFGAQSLPLIRTLFAEPDTLGD